MAWYYVLNGESKGPVEESALQDLHRQNIVMPDTPVWTDGMAQWVPYQSSPVAADGTVATTTDVRHACAECGKVFPEDEMLRYENSWVCAACKPLFFQRIKEGVAPVGVFTYAGFWRRFGAYFVDAIIIDIFVLLPVLFIFGFAGLTHSGLSTGVNILIITLQYAFPALYEIIFIGKFGATPGKMLLNVRVVMADGGRVSYGRATGRYFAKLLSALIFCIGFLMVAWDEEKRGLHDRICNTRVIYTGGA